MSGLSDKVSGKAKQTAGDVTGDDKLKAEGSAEEFKGKLKDGFGKLVDTVSDKIESSKKKSEK